MPRKTEKLIHSSENQTSAYALDTINGQDQEKLGAKKIIASLGIGAVLGTSIVGGSLAAGVEIGHLIKDHPSKSVELDKGVEEQLNHAAEAVAHRYDSGCEITSIVDLHKAPEGTDLSGPRTTLTVELKLTRSPAAEAAMIEYASPSDTRVQWSKPIFSAGVDINGESGGAISTPTGFDNEIDEQFGLVRDDTDNSYKTSVTLYPLTTDPNGSSIQFGLYTDAYHGATHDESRVHCDGAAVYENGSWQLATN